MSKLALIVQFEVRPECREEFLDLIRGHAAATRTLEQGCLQFDVLLPQSEPHPDDLPPESAGQYVYLYEVYRDEQALASHLKSERLPKIHEAYEPMVLGRSSTTCVVDEPT